MRSKNKAPMSSAERAWVDLVAQLNCSVCDAPGPSQVHEPEQSLWFGSVALCPACHGPGAGDGWHGTKARWKLRKMTMLLAINVTVSRVFALIVNAKPAKARAPTMRAPTPKANSATQRSSKTVPRRL